MERRVPRTFEAYEDEAVGSFVHVKDFGATGDGTTDDTEAFQAALWGSSGKILFVDDGSYLLTSTVTVPLGTKMVGETCSQLVAYGSYFSDASNPNVMLKVGDAGEVGDIESSRKHSCINVSNAPMMLTELANSQASEVY
ncbi:hypothetical protein PFICI_01680 [Pestalotiopsis fici W106-1]|uniref:Rhamnogalacturonase A/B/Epimerase-like pectate lyase domain-containing protein n=1 Tax=Pestalotiopsis fici (strain W106-1 / CGMCC3.15140) TaxID=1229662 RepID=W3XQR2_PESFW|nr:uncharacterized protein PFICI_01680 [Pestalotiopsis fici W106-1]ETS87852.1 hypothetical protein PFICI_01680 [Pestalotiopsis fici W106-1]